MFSFPAYPHRQTGFTKPMQSIACLLTLLLSSLAGALFAQPDPGDEAIIEVEPEFREGNFKLSEWHQHKTQLFQLLNKNRVVEAEAFTMNFYNPFKDAPEESESAKQVGGNARKLIEIGTTMRTDLSVSFADADLQQKISGQSIGLLKQIDEGFVWTSIIESEGATALRLHFENFDLPQGVALYLYNESGQAQGPYSGKGLDEDGEFWSHTIFGERIVLQLHAEDGADLKSVRFDIVGLLPTNDRFLLAKGYNDLVAHKLCDRNVDCVENAMCQSGFNTFKKAAAHIKFIENGRSYLCSGALINDTASGAIPWFTTANHCIAYQNVAETVEAFFRYQSECGECQNSLTGLPSVVGADLRAHGKGGDFSLLELNGFPSGGYGLLGWTTGKVKNDDGRTVYVIGHPKGSPQAFSQAEVNANNRPDYPLIQSTNVFGTQEKGSSGSGTIVSGGKWVGPFVAFQPLASLDLCDPSTFNGLSGAFSEFKESLLPYLNPGNNYPLHVEEMNVQLRVNPIPIYIITALVQDKIGNPVPHATVRIKIRGNQYTTVKTRSDGTVFLTWPYQSNFSACVDDITHDYFYYDEASNVETCSPN